MGHIRLDRIPKSKKWTAVVETVAGGAVADASFSDSLTGYVDQVAQKTLEAAEGGLEVAINDIGLQYTFYLLTQMALAARGDNWQQRLRHFGIVLSADSSFEDLIAEMQASIDDYVFAQGAAATDLSEIAQQAAGEALTELIAPKAVTLFGAGADELRLAVRDMSTKKGFSTLGQKFFGAFTARLLNFYLSRITASTIGSEVLAQVGDITQFKDALRLHCEQSAFIVRDFSGEWYSKTEYKEGIDLHNTKGFVAVAIKKLQAELRHQGVEE